MAYPSTYGQDEGAAKRALSVSAAMALAKGALEGVTVRLVGEVSELSNKPGYKAVYFTVKDTGAALPCMMWNNRYRAAGVELRIGMLVELTGRFTLYAAKGRMNFDVFSLQPAGEGNLRLKVADLARKLQAEGLMRSDRKRPLPLYPETIGLVTSPRGAAVHDVLRTLRRRYPLAKVLLAGVPVEGPQAPAALVEGMQRVVVGGAEVVLVVRGGGSFEDLMPFNDESLARAIADMPVPVVTGIGHEPDTSIADMVSDLRASTPTAAAEAVAPDAAALLMHVRSLGQAASSALDRRVSLFRAQVDRAAARPLFVEPSRLFEADALALDDMAQRLGDAIPRQLQNDRVRLKIAGVSLGRMLPRLTAAESHKAQVMRDRLIARGAQLSQPFAREVAVAAGRLHALSPLSVIARGYAVARNTEGRVVKSIEQVSAGQAIEVSVSDGTIACSVNGTAAAAD